MRSDLHRYMFAACFAATQKYAPDLRVFPPRLLPDHVNVDEETIPFKDRFRVQMGKHPSSTVVVGDVGVTSGRLDGEIVVVLNEAGTPDFNALQNAFAVNSSKIVYYVFDAPFFGGYDLRNVPLRDRRAMLARLFADK